MKKFLLLLSVFLSTLSLAAQNTASFSIQSKQIEPGQTVELDVTIKNSDKTATSAFQFDLEVPEGLTFERTNTSGAAQYFKRSNNLKDLGDDEISYTCTSASQSGDGNPVTKIRVVLYEGTGNISFSELGLPNEFVIGTVKVKAADNFTGASDITMSGAIIAGSGGEGGVGQGSDQTFEVVNSKGDVIDPKEPAAEAEVYIPATGLTLDKTSLTVAAGSSAAALKATPAPAGNYPVTWTSSDEKVATVDAEGVVTGVSKGTATITATIIATDPDAAKSATCAVTVTAPAPTGVTLNKTTATIKVGATETLTATLTPENADASNLTWTSSDQTVATVDADGVVTGVKAGTATITATAAEDVTATCEVTVENVYLTSITLDPTTASLKAGDSQAFTPAFTPANATIQTLTWTLSGDGASCAEVDAEGKVTIKDVTGDNVGKTITVTATSAEGAVAAGSEAVTATATITLAATPIEVITLKVEPAQIKDGETAVITATIEPATATYPTVNFTLDGTTVTKVEPAEGEDPVANQITVVAGATLGKTTIKATPSTAVTGDAEPMTIDVEVIATPVTGITLSTEPDANSMKGGATMTFTATVAPETATNKEVTWSVSDESLATITPEGVLTAKTGVTGTVTVTATSKSETNVTATKEIEIIGVVVTAITLDPTEKTLAQGGELTIVPTLTGETIDGVDVEPTNKTITWSAAWAEDATFEGTAPAVADFVTVEDGKVTIVKVSPETATKKVVITAKPNGATTDITATCTITLEKTNVTAVAVTAPEGTAAKPALKQDETLQLTATVTPENATYQTVTWSSSSTDVTVSETGLVTIVKVTEETANDEVTITATTTDPDATTVNGTFTITLAPTPVETVKADLTAVTLLPGTKVNGKVTEVGPENATIKTLEATSKADATATITLADDNTFTITGVAKGNTTATIAATSGTENAKAEITVAVEEALTITTDARQNPETDDAQVAKKRQIKYTANTTLPVTWSIVNEEKTEEAAPETPEAATEAFLAEEPTEGEGGNSETGEGEGDNNGEGEGDNSGEGEGTDTPATTDNEVAYIAETGFDAETGLAYCLVEGIAPGTATVTATIDPENIADGADETKLKAEDKIEVINVLADKITLSATKLTMSKGDTKELTATLTPEEGVEEAVSIQEVEWTVSNEKVLEVVEEGDLTISFKALANGTCTITATTVDSSDLTAECVITVAPTVTGIEAVGIDEAESSFIRVYDLSGKCVATSAEQYTRLGEGLYIVKTAKRTIKVLKADIAPAGL